MRYGHRYWTCPLLRRRFILHASVLQHVRPLAAGALVTMFQVLTEVIGSEKLLPLVTLPKLVYEAQVLGANIPLWRVRKFFTTVAADITSCGQQ